ncbi:putative mitochondrial hypothetical protein [Leptomonas pyrrhocoris]|uniref:Uncharacterized protein n=1 Tax=Leptomonas pyrrhocoris TaxID=157538 RepID=A0A0M9GAN0_LEPPY|nr:putative mitochondrial hypothetical protein [Leptomonas pyrrhocoris]XP_015664782.1 putative mitochondrial hypothetical protein [Leptomonas pyrrhocoris]KPA86342.1 putative mitochondrial hypothetical protein [Leptomonas pyrrhocoris]KPA86343.1 putative mitochondrial hypothetical protein [Leptomonas pyrrhocoris]|eukprot:XP_015664781.1 putative mitochondrial hypothetical protein [Leptomonas pyrrhocoris]
MKEAGVGKPDAFGYTLRPSQHETTNDAAPAKRTSRSSELSSMKMASAMALNGGAEEDELDVRASQVTMEALDVDMPARDLQLIMNSALSAYNKHVFLPTRTTWRKDEGSRRELERDVERTALSSIAADIKKDITDKLGGCWHVIYGHDFATFVTHKRLRFCHFQIEGADVVVWRHGG